MDTRRHMIIANNKIITKDVKFCSYNKQIHKYEVQFQDGGVYKYNFNNIIWMKEPKALNPRLYQIRHKGYILSNVVEIYVFEDMNRYSQKYWHIFFENGEQRDYAEWDLEIEEAVWKDAVSKNVFAYLQQIASLSELKNDDGKGLLQSQYDKMDFVGKKTALSRYLNPKTTSQKSKTESIPIFPFGCNQSQYKAVKTAMENPISVIEGPPGTGKTQTILNIIANILLMGKTVQVVSNNNSATDNVLEKLASPTYNMGFMAAPLGKAENRQKFIENQTGEYPDLSAWKRKDENSCNLEDIKNLSEQLGQVFYKQERLALLKQELSELELEMRYFRQYKWETDINYEILNPRKSLHSAKLMQMWQEYQDISNRERKMSILFKIRSILRYGLSNWKFYNQDLTKMITSLQETFYDIKRKELLSEIGKIEYELKQKASVSVERVSDLSMEYLKSMLYDKYGGREKRKIFTDMDLWKNPSLVLEEYPIVLSTTFSSRVSLGKDTVYDYLIMDEASQVDVATGALALSCARNVVIVGDTKQLPNVVTGELRVRAKTIFESFHISEGYDFANKSFLQSVMDIIPDVTQTMLREHYRCHPKIINFCNQKFYGGNLVVMTKDNGEENVLSAIRTAPGNHERNHYSQRQIDVLKEEVLPKITSEKSEIGIIAPYNNQVDAIKKEIKDIDTATVHKFQGREKDTIIISTVDDEITDFADDPYLLNVAVSRAKSRLCVIVTGNEQPADKNICDLLAYIRYNNFEIADSKIYSVFDYLYKQYTKSRFEYLKMHKKVSEYDSENLMYLLIKDILRADKFLMLDVVCHQPLKMLIRNPELLNDAEFVYAMNNATHLDFLIYNKLGKIPVLAIEVDGYDYHKEGEQQAKRDAMKNHILTLYGIPYLRFVTNGSREREKIIEKLEDIMG